MAVGMAVGAQVRRTGGHSRAHVRSSGPGSARRPAITVPAATRSVGQLLHAAHTGLADAAASDRPDERYVAAHLAALRAAAAVVARRARPAGPPTRRSRPTSVWVLLAAVAPELGEWADFFAAGARKRQAAEAGVRSAVSQREADDLLRDAETFLAVVATTLGSEHPGPPLAATG